MYQTEFGVLNASRSASRNREMPLPYPTFMQAARRHIRQRLYRPYDDGRASLSNSYAPTRTLAVGTMDGLRCIENSHLQDTFLPSRSRRRLRSSPRLGEAQQRLKRTNTTRKRTICAVPVRNGERNTLKSPQATTLGSFHE
jgi:hypothetical protein